MFAERTNTLVVQHTKTGIFVLLFVRLYFCYHGSIFVIICASCNLHDRLCCDVSCNFTSTCIVNIVVLVQLLCYE